MKQISIRQLVKQSKDIEKYLPCELTRDGEIIATILPYDVKQRDSALRPLIKQQYKDIEKLTELPLSKARQAKHTW